MVVQRKYGYEWLTHALCARARVLDDGWVFGWGEDEAKKGKEGFWSLSYVFSDCVLQKAPLLCSNK